MTAQATVEVLTAEVRVLVVSNRQITRSAYRQLDAVSPDEIEPLGRVRPDDDDCAVCVAGRHRDTGALVRSFVSTYDVRDWYRETREIWSALPLVVLGR